MKPKYECPNCKQQFSRRSNMRQHCKSQHKFDPFPVDFPKPQFGARINQKETVQNKGTSTLDAKFDEMIGQCQKFEGLARGGGLAPKVVDPIPSHEEAINHMLDNYVTIDKKEIHGISGHVCNNCLTFHFHYIKDIGSDLTAQEKHRCLPADVERANQISNKAYAIIFLRHNSIDCLSNIINWVFGKELSITAQSEAQVEIFEPDGYTTEYFQIKSHIPVIRLDALKPEHWACAAIQTGNSRITDGDLKKILEGMIGTFATISIKQAPYSGTYLLSISGSTK